MPSTTITSARPAPLPPSLINGSDRNRRHQPPAFDGRIAHRAFFAAPHGDPGHRIYCVTRGDGGFSFVQRHGADELTELDLFALVERMNEEIGVPMAAAGALQLDRRWEFTKAPVAPADFAAYRKDKLLFRSAAQGGLKLTRSASDAYLRLASVKLYAGPFSFPFMRQAWLIAREEWSWATSHDRLTWEPSPKLRKALQSERAAVRVCQALQVLLVVKDKLRENSRWAEWQERRTAFCHDGRPHRFTEQKLARADAIAAWRASPARRRAVLRAWRESRPALRKALAAIRAYSRTRPRLKELVPGKVWL